MAAEAILALGVIAPQGGNFQLAIEGEVADIDRLAGCNLECAADRLIVAYQVGAAEGQVPHF
ncbi:hypothetical protein D9M70_580530 [compost metagenome]